MIGGTAGSMTAGLSPADTRPACGARTVPGHEDPTTAIARSATTAAPTASIRGRATRALPTRSLRTRRIRTSGLGTRGLGTRSLGTRGIRTRGARTSIGTTTGAAGSGACIAFWMEAESSPQKSSGRTGVGAAASPVGLAAPGALAAPAAPPDALGPNGTNSSRGPNQSRGNWTTLSVESTSSSPGGSWVPSFSTFCRRFPVGRGLCVLPAG